MPIAYILTYLLIAAGSKQCDHITDYTIRNRTKYKKFTLGYKNKFI